MTILAVFRGTDMNMNRVASYYIFRRHKLDMSVVRTPHSDRITGSRVFRNLYFEDRFKFRRLKINIFYLCLLRHNYKWRRDC